MSPRAEQLKTPSTYVTGECIVWTGNLNERGYGRRYVDTASGRRLRYVHRLAWIERHGEIPADLTVDHLCANTSCYNVDHLELVTRRENSLRQSDRNRRANCPSGHAMTTENTYINPASGAHACRECNRIRARKAGRKP